MRGGDAEPPELDGDGRGEVSGGLERVDRFERVAALAVVLRGAGGKLRGELLGDCDEARSGFSVGCEFDWHREFSDPLVRARGRSVAPPTSLMRGLAGRDLDGDGHAVGDHVVDR